MLNLRHLFLQDIHHSDRANIQTKAKMILKRKNYKFIEKLGAGKYGDVISIMSKEDKKRVAAKVLHKNMTSHGELYLWPQITHPNILPLLDVIRGDEVYIFVMPQLAGNLVNILHNPKFRHNEELFDMTIDWMRDMLNGLEYLHSLGICHLDLKCDNILITYNFRAVIGDFSSLIEAKEPIDLYVLPKYYCPPEAWSKVQARPIVDGNRFDIWSSGMIFLYCFSNRDFERQLWGRKEWMVDIYPLMFNCLQKERFTVLMQRAHPCCKISAMKCSLALNLLRGILRYKATDRPTAKDILDHPFLSEKSEIGNLFEEDSVWIRNQRDSNIKREKSNFKIDTRKVMLEGSNLSIAEETVTKVLLSKDPVPNADACVSFEIPPDICNHSINKDREIGSRMLNNNPEDALAHDVTVVSVNNDVKTKRVSAEYLKNIDGKKEELQDRNIIQKTENSDMCHDVTVNNDVKTKSVSAEYLKNIDGQKEELEDRNIIQKTENSDMCKKKKTLKFGWLRQKFAGFSKIISGKKMKTLFLM